jgi:hypothetical protein
MRSAAQLKPLEPPLRELYRTLRGWAIGLLLETHAIKECEEHGHMQDRTDLDAWMRAREIASKYPFRGATPAESVRALDDVMASIGDTCPECR